MMSAHALMSSTQKSRSDTPSRLLRAYRQQSLAAVASKNRSVSYVVPARAQQPMGRNIHAPDRILHAVNVAQEHHGIGHQVVAEGNGLRALQVRVAGQNVALVRLGLLHERREHVLRERNACRSISLRRYMRRSSAT